MSEEQTVDTTTTEKKEKTREELLAESVIIARFEYVAALQYAANLMNSSANKRGKKLTAKNIQRAVFTAIDHGITDSKIKLTNEAEAHLAGVLAKIFDLRTLLQADKMNQQKEKEKTNEETNSKSE